ncbi:AAA family ATPase [Aquirhabdus sp.]|uniref:AAA family ATPase n=1 Tax=Aquirhabdus sp. TaxID=2824160 RepID=UPI00396CC167
MTLPRNFVNAVYQDSFGQYVGNPLIEALPPILEPSQIKAGLQGNVVYDEQDIFKPGTVRAHLIAQLLNNFFQPIARHIELESKLSIMIREGYVGRNLENGLLNAHLQNGYERVMAGSADVYRFESAKSTARSLSFMGCSGSGKSTTLNRILATYPQVIYHEKYNFTQLVYLKIDCPHDGSLKNLCLHFFRAIDVALHTDYERKYALKRHSVETLLNLMRQIANVHAIGVLIIDEIQHLSLNRSGGAEKMLNFFVTLVNVVGLPVVMVGTPKARFIFEGDLRSARRGAGFGSICWDPMKDETPQTHPDTGRLMKTEWIAFTNALWKYQWLKHRDLTLSEEIRACWFDLSQGVLDIVVKLFVLAQHRAITTGLERITTKLLKQVYQDELKPVHPMIEALRSGDPEKIAAYSDLVIPDIDKKLLLLQAKIAEHYDELEESSSFYNGHEQAERLHNLLISMDYRSDLIVPLVKRAFADHPNLNMQKMMPIVMAWLNETDSLKPQEAPAKTEKIKPKEWHTLGSTDLRFLFSQVPKDSSFYDQLKPTGMIFDIGSWVRQAG